jgi:hypothetical protein
VRRALETVGRLASDYAESANAQGVVIALEPTRVLGILAERIGRSKDDWQSAWSVLEEIDKQQASLVSPAQLNVLIAALAYLPADTQFDSASTGSEVWLVFRQQAGVFIDGRFINGCQSCTLKRCP